MINKATLIGHVGADPESRYMPNGNAVVNFSLATTEKWKDAQGNKAEKTSWHRLVCFGKLSEVITQYVKKGDKLYIEGRIDYQEYEKDGVKKYSTQIIVNNMQMLGGQGNGQQGHAPAQQAPQRQSAPASGSPAASSEFDSEIPFNAVHSYP